MKGKIGTIVLTALLGFVQPTSAYTITGDQGLRPVRLKHLKTKTTVDLRRAEFHVAISRNASPSRRQTCRKGIDRVNRYPMAVENSKRVRIVGGRFDGSAPLTSDWRWTYCNSAALRIEGSNGPRIEGQRIRRSWDGIRIDNGSDKFRISGVWLSEMRDDCVENDHLQSGEIRDSLFDKCFAGISMAPRKNTKRKAHLKMSGVLLRLQEYTYKGQSRHALPFKVNGKNSRVEIHDSILAIESGDLIGGKHSEIMWRSIEKCSNNLLLWMRGGPVPSTFRYAPKCFRILRGAEARKVWNSARKNWVDCHGNIGRFAEDSQSRPSNCKRHRYGGKGAKAGNK